jgi:type II secretory pathway component GspD/PulD (secretin)
VTVTDTREVQEQVEELINAENRSVGRQVRMRMQIVDLTSTTNNDMGVNWAWLINDAAAKWNLNFFSPAGLPGGSSGFGQLGIIRNGNNSSTSTFLQALATVGKVNIRKDETYSMMNNRPLSVANTENFIYPARSSSASNSNNNSTTVVPGVDPGQLTTGTFLNMRSSIQPNGSVIVQFSMDASMRGDTVTFVNNGVTLQYPQSTANQYQIYTSIVNGETAVLAGVENIQQQATDKSFDGKLTPLLGGGVATNTSRRAVLVLLTPQIVEGVN